MRTVDIIQKKRDGNALTEAEIRQLIQGYVAGTIPEYQISAWLMAVFFRGMDFQEAGFLTRAMIDSGSRITFPEGNGILVDKHSTGGVGDKLSLILAPLAAACGVKVPMMSGRALGHTGGTLDKLEAIPGYRTDLTPARFKELVLEKGFAMTGQSKDIVPADRLLYALRDVTSTVESVPLITASILSKKFAEGAHALVFDVKCGPGAFMKTLEDAERLAISLVNTGKSLGQRVAAVITRMEEPLGRLVGNFLEVDESVSCLTAEGPGDVMEVTLRLTAWMLLLAERVGTLEEGLTLAREKLADGSAWKAFQENVTAQGGDLDAMNALLGKRHARYTRSITAGSSGFVTGIDAYAAGMASVYLGVGRNTAADAVLPHVGIEFLKKPGSPVTRGETLCIMYGESEDALDNAVRTLEPGIAIGAVAPEHKSLIIKEFTSI